MTRPHSPTYPLPTGFPTVLSIPRIQSLLRHLGSSHEQHCGLTPAANSLSNQVINLAFKICSLCSSALECECFHPPAGFGVRVKESSPGSARHHRWAILSAIHSLPWTRITGGRNFTQLDSPNLHGERALWGHPDSIRCALTLQSSALPLGYAVPPNWTTYYHKWKSQNLPWRLDLK